MLCDTHMHTPDTHTHTHTDTHTHDMRTHGDTHVRIPWAGRDGGCCAELMQDHGLLGVYDFAAV